MSSSFVTMGAAALAIITAFVAASIILTTGHYCLGALAL